MGKCTDGFIKFRTLKCGDAPFTESKSGLYFEDLEGISIGRIADVTTEKYKGVTDLMDSRTNFAINLLIEELLSKLPDNKFKQAVRTHRFGHFSERYLPTKNKERGVLLRKANTPLSFFYIEYVTVKSNTTKLAHEIKVFEGSVTSPDNVKTYTVDLEAGKEKKVEINYKSFSNQVFVVSNNSDILVNDSHLYGPFYKDNQETHYSYGYPFLICSGWDGDQKDSNSYGIKVEYSIRCDKEALFCKLAMENKIAVLYRAGVEILKEWLSGDRLTFVSIYSEDWAKAKLKEWQELSSYYLDIAVEAMGDYLTDLDCVCLPCSGNQIVKVMP